jgi:hypothetical protein
MDKPTEQFRQQILNRAGGVCKCTMKTCDHPSDRNGRCTRTLRGEWELHRFSPSLGYTANGAGQIKPLALGWLPELSELNQAFHRAGQEHEKMFMSVPKLACRANS